MDDKANNSNSELLTQPEDTERHKPSDDQLSHEFKGVPFIFYRFWLILNFLLVLLWEYDMIWEWLLNTFEGPKVSRYGIFTMIGLMFFLIGCCQMLYAISRKKPKLAQEGFIKLQYALITSVVGWIVQFDGAGEWLGEKEMFGMFAQIIHVIGGVAVMRVFKRNSLGERIPDDSNSSVDVLEQNEVLKYDKQLDRWPYFVYQCFLKFSFMFELVFVFRVALPSLINMWRTSPENKERQHIDLHMYLFFAEWTISSFLNACSCFQMEVAIRTRNLEKSKKTIFLLKICVVLAIIKCFFIGKCLELDSTLLRGKGKFIWYLGYSVVVPMVSFLGALKVNKILEHREDLGRIF